MHSPYNFPEKDLFRAMEITEPQFKIQSDKELFESLWIDFSSVRSNNHFKQMKKRLGMVNNELKYSPNTYSKIIYSGHRGSGKSVELKRFSNEINNNNAFFSVFIDLETETNIEQLSAEDIYVVLITMLIRNLEEQDVDFNKDDLGDIANEWISEKAVEKELKNSFGLEAGLEVKLGWSFWKLFSAEGNLKSGFSRDNTITNTIRRIVKSNPKPLIEKFNAALVNIRTKIKEEGKGRDLIFFIDGLEKANRKVYEELFIKDVQMITGLQVNIITTVPIDTYYEIIEQGNRFYFKDFYLPMIRITEESKPIIKNLIYKRVDKSLIDIEAMNNLVEMSGGCPRILLKMVSRGFLETEEDKITLEVAKMVIQKEGNERFRTLTNEHKTLIRSNNFDDADNLVRELLQSLTVLEYNGNNPERKLNPVLERFFT